MRPVQSIIIIFTYFDSYLSARAPCRQPPFEGVQGKGNRSWVPPFSCSSEHVGSLAGVLGEALKGLGGVRGKSCWDFGFGHVVSQIGRPRGVACACVQTLEIYFPMCSAYRGSLLVGVGSMFCPRHPPRFPDPLSVFFTFLISLACPPDGRPVRFLSIKVGKTFRWRNDYLNTFENELEGIHRQGSTRTCHCIETYEKHCLGSTRRYHRD